jgi:hypothetical protein
MVNATWDDVPHLTEKDKAELRKSYPPFQRDARTKGIPQLGAGAIYPVPESEILVDPFPIPAYFPRVYALDVGWNKTAALWAAIDQEADTVFLYAEHYRGHAEPAIHAAAIRARGEWMNGVIDPAARGRGQKDGERLLQAYRDLGLKLTPAVNAVDAGIFEVWTRLATGRLKVFKTLQNWLAEYRIYRRDEHGAIVKENDHLMDDTRYLLVSGLAVMGVDPKYLQKMGFVNRGVQSDYDPLA